MLPREQRSHTLSVAIVSYRHAVIPSPTYSILIESDLPNPVAHKFLPTLETLLTAPNGEPGWEASFFSQDAKGEPLEEVARYVVRDSRVRLNDTLPAGITPKWTLKLNGNLNPDHTGPFELGLTVSGRAKLWIDDKLLIDNWTKQVPGDFFYGSVIRFICS